MKKIICTFLVLCICLGNCITTSALMPAHINNVTILGNDIITMRIDDTITLEAVADSAGFNVAYMCWGTDKSGIVSIDGDDGTKELAPPISTATVTALSKGRVVVTVYAEMDFVEPEDYYEHDSVIINVVSKDEPYISEIETDSIWYELYEGEECSIKAIADVVGLDYAYMSWKVDNESVVSIECEEENTKLFPPKSYATVKALSPGLTDITIYADCNYPVTENAVFAKIKVKVIKKGATPVTEKVWNVEIKDDSPKTIYVGDKISVAAIAEQSDYNKEWAYFMWNSSNESVAVVNSDTENVLCNPPVTTAEVKAVSEGTVVITVYADTENFLEPTDSSKYDSIVINVIKSPDVVPDININSVVLNFCYDIYSIQMTNDSNYSADNVRLYTSYYSRDGRLINVDVSEIYTIEGKDEITTFIPINECFADAATVKIMLWDGANKPLVEAVMPKEFKLQISDLPPENREDRELFFYDVSIDNKYYDAIYMIHKNFESIGFGAGYEDGSFKPELNVLKAEFACVLNKMIGNDFVSNKFRNIDVDCNIVDVEQTHWCRDEIGYLVSENIMSLDKGYFKPNENITLTEVLSSYLKVLGEKEFDESEIMTLSNGYSLLENIEISDEPITREIFAQLITNFVNAYLKD